MKKKRKNSKKNSLRYIVYILLLAIFSLSFFIAGVYIGENTNKKSLQKTQNVISMLEKKIKNLSNQLNQNNKKSYNLPSEIEDYETAHKHYKKTKPTVAVTVKLKTKKPKLVIILDDVSFGYQVKAIKHLPFEATPSFFPPTKIHPHTPVYAKEFKDYMVHVPMQALAFAHPEPDTIDTDWSYSQIKQRIDKIKKWFPKAEFINNHTGSKFTADKVEMEKLFRVLKEDNLGFVDSRTTPYSKARDAEKIYHIPFFERNIFLDNKPDINYIQNQLKKAVKIARKRGYAIAIGHPHKTTIEALNESQNILKNVDVITINQLYELKTKNEK
ncbi:divergent polysaccharide deacetylase family protein [Lebetimonas sp. JH292]|uniref:divergent polysaccharide deacetylase family protein n=1 Tax=Lebetimonas sp. JH292 TaxID=990068 RepID=UPI0004639DE7|nr:divergent polysaccharide deacetylase family protein [Lebetimonas sp. JH292]